MRDHEDLWTAVRARERSRSLVRTATIAAGAAGLAAAGLVAYTLPGPRHQQSGGQTSAKPAQPVSQARSGDDGGENDGGSSAAQPAPSLPPAQAPPQVTSGGS